ncbi:hypothetical protein DA100_08925 [Vibrio sp. Hep-1b-8]|nr:hypothetical protein DA100_08925 [Vibrio sp. Hep-1b-8]
MNHKYILTKQSQYAGEHEIHNATTGCTYMPRVENLIKLGLHSSSQSALEHAKNTFPELKINGCYYCCHACHTS